MLYSLGYLVDTGTLSRDVLKFGKWYDEGWLILVISSYVRFSYSSVFMFLFLLYTLFFHVQLVPKFIPCVDKRFVWMYDKVHACDVWMPCNEGMALGSAHMRVVRWRRAVFMFLNLMDVLESMFSLSFLIYNVSDLLVCDLIKVFIEWT